MSRCPSRCILRRHDSIKIDGVTRNYYDGIRGPHRHLQVGSKAEKFSTTISGLLLDSTSTRSVNKSQARQGKARQGKHENCWIDMSGCRWLLTKAICACVFMNKPWQYENDSLRIISRQQRVRDVICQRNLVRLTKTEHSSPSTNQNTSVSDSGQANWRSGLALPNLTSRCRAKRSDTLLGYVILSICGITLLNKNVCRLHPCSSVTSLSSQAKSMMISSVIDWTSV